MFLYFLPNHSGAVSRAQFESLGLGYALSAGDPDARVVTAGPEGLAGVVSGPQPVGGVRGPDTLYEPAKQSWRKGPGGKYFVGHYKHLPPTPASLRRERLIHGEETRLRGGHEWIVPIARSIVRGTSLPKEMVLGEDNESWEERELEEYLSLCRDAERVFEVFCAPDVDASSGQVSFNIERQDAMRICVAALAVNYRVAAVEVSMLRLTNDDVTAVLRSLCDWPAFERVVAERQKKSESAPGTSSTDGGPGDTSPDTCPPLAT